MSAIVPPPHKLAAARWRGQRVGLLGGSFDPAHAGHMHIAKQAMIRFRLNAVWWLVSPGNPAKGGTRADLQKRVAATAAFIERQPRMAASGLEAQLGTRYTRDTLRALRRLFPATTFVWIAGMDNAQTFHRWRDWAALPHIVPFAFFDRPPAAAKIRGKKLKANKRIRQHAKTHTHRPKKAETGVFWVTRGRAVNLSSTLMRKK